MAKTMMAMTLLLLACACQKASDSADRAAHRVANAADALADRSDNWGDNASNAIDREGPITEGRIARANARLERLAEPGIPTDAWIGRWTGVEGLTLEIEEDAKGGPGHYRLNQRYTLDDKGVFLGQAVGDTIQFHRPDGDQVLRATDGAATGLKWLATKKNCLTVKPGEGYCRD